MNPALYFSVVESIALELLMGKKRSAIGAEYVRLTIDDYDENTRKGSIIVAGGSKGIGKQLAVSLLSRGCNVSIIARNEADLKAACKELQTIADQRAQKQKVRWYSLDLTKGYSEVESVIRQAEEELGPVDALINNAGTSVQVSNPGRLS
ncbi:hypothetical protein TELCIR_11052 [Teladorsagia circumcincta]|uniref:Oxidoreductase, short chain dehydrogenase/reductase family protein n=1 Tax=Teladorsagia circumcincta TaxID=45464 RepID=A0A2G9UCL7_TELCI|nr:hypothetical protein TELCIR_11052 [Teladorsagia circumcincta]